MSTNRSPTDQPVYGRDFAATCIRCRHPRTIIGGGGLCHRCCDPDVLVECVACELVGSPDRIGRTECPHE